MPLVLNCQSLVKRFGLRTVFERVSLSVFDGDRIGLIGPNGAGKSTLLEILAERQPPDEGIVSIRKLARIAYVRQEESFADGVTVADVLERALPEGLDDAERLARLAEGLGRGGFARGDQPVAALSGGWRKRLAIAEALMADPDLLLLDEPTNHLDVAGILWLEGLLTSARFASLTVSHDRYFLENAATHMIEINRAYPDGTYQTKGNYSEFLERREEFLISQAKQREALATLVRREIEWLRRGPKARTTKSKARIETAGRLMDELADAQARNASGTAAIDFMATGRKTKRLVTFDGVSKQLGGRCLFRGVSFVLGPGTRLGLLGPNGCGKTTMLRLLSGDAAPDTGTIERAEQLQVVYFDQDRRALVPGMPLRRAMCPDGDTVLYRGRPVHVNGWAKRFLFRPEQLEQPVASLSGGEQARLLIARLMLQPADLLLLDEPTNDLDIPTLEVLEESLLDFPGALALVTHDRYLLDRVSTVLLALDGEGGAGFFADFSQWEQTSLRKKTSKAPRESEPVRASAAPVKKRLSYLEAREYEQMETRILEAEAALADCESRLQAPEVVSDPREIERAYVELEAARSAVDALYARWAELEAKLV